MSADRPLGRPVKDWTPPPFPDGATMEGRYARLEPLTAERHAMPLYRAFQGHDALWDYMPTGPFSSEAELASWMRSATQRDDAIFFAIHDKDRGALGGFASYLRIKPGAGTIEIGFIALAPSLQGTRAATDAFFLMIRWAFDAGYRRVEWKCDALNAASRRAAQRLGFGYDGIFLQATVVKGRNRDTAWFAILDTEWPALSRVFERWLSEENFGPDRTQKERLSDLTRPLLRTRDPGQ